jgi:hypothetical protein
MQAGVGAQGEGRTSASSLVPTGGGGVTVDNALAAIVGEIVVSGELVTAGAFAVFGAGSVSRGDFEFANIFDKVLVVLI